MRWGGVIILLFIVCHILDLTTGTVNPQGEPGQPVRQRRRRLRPGALVRHVFYIVAMVALGLHLRHGFFSALRSPRPADAARASAGPKIAALVFAVALVGGFLPVPFAVMTGVVS